MSRSKASRVACLLMRHSGFFRLGPECSSVAACGTRSKFTHSKEGKVLHPDLLNAAVLKTQYAVRGELYLRAEELRKAGKEIIFTNGVIKGAE
jgi:hypothetical protein